MDSRVALVRGPAIMNQWRLYLAIKWLTLESDFHPTPHCRQDVEFAGVKNWLRSGHFLPQWVLSDCMQPGLPTVDWTISIIGSTIGLNRFLSAMLRLSQIRSVQFQTLGGSVCHYLTISLEFLGTVCSSYIFSWFNRRDHLPELSVDYQSTDSFRFGFWAPLVQC